MNKRLKKKKNIERIIVSYNVIMQVLAEHNYCYQNGVKRDISYNNWIKTVNGKRCFSSLRKKYNVPRYINFKRKKIKY